MSVYSHPDGSLYDDPNVENFHKPPVVRVGSHPELNVVNSGSYSTLVPQSLALSGPEVSNLLSTIGESILTTSQAIVSTPSDYPRGAVSADPEMYAQGLIDDFQVMDHVAKQQPTSTVSMISTHPTIPHLSSTVSNSPSLESVAQTYVTATRDYINISAPHTVTESTSFGPSSLHYVTNYAAPMFSGMYTPPSMDTYSPYVGPEQAPGPNSGVLPTGATMPSQMVKELQRVVPADMKTQEHMKVERKKARNRIAASKCRLRRLQRESELQGKVKILKDHNQELNSEVTELKEQINSLKRALVQHMQGGCRVSVPEGYSLSPN